LSRASPTFWQKRPDRRESGLPQRWGGRAPPLRCSSPPTIVSIPTVLRKLAHTREDPVPPAWGHVDWADDARGLGAGGRRHVQGAPSLARAVEGRGKEGALQSQRQRARTLSKIRDRDAPFEVAEQGAFDSVPHGWRNFHHPPPPYIAGYGFLISERA
jgi:hypothetical protein